MKKKIITSKFEIYENDFKKYKTILWWPSARSKELLINIEGSNYLFGCTIDRLVAQQSRIPSVGTTRLIVKRLPWPVDQQLPSTLWHWLGWIPFKFW